MSGKGRRGFIISFDSVMALFVMFALLAVLYSVLRDQREMRPASSELGISALARDTAVLSGLKFAKNASTGAQDSVAEMLYRLPAGLCGRVYLSENNSPAYFGIISRGDCVDSSAGQNAPLPVAYWAFDAEQERGEGKYNSTYSLDAGANMANCLVGAGSLEHSPKRLEREGCRRGGCYLFDRIDDRLVCGNSSRLVPGGDFTLGGWIKLEAGYPGSRGIAQIAVLDPPGPDLAAYELYIESYSDSHRIGANFARPRSGFIDAPVTPGEWHHFALTIRKGNLSLYLDGELRNSTLLLAGPAISGALANFTIGGGSGRAFNGTIDELKYFSRALAPEEIRREAGDGLFGIYSFDYDVRSPITHGNVIDESGNWNELRVLENATQAGADRAGAVFGFGGNPAGAGALENTTIANFTQVTVSMWIKQRSYGSGSNRRGLAARNHSFAFYSNSLEDDGLTLEIGRTTNSPDRLVINSAPEGVVPLGEWHQVAFTYGNSIPAIYLDGAAVVEPAYDPTYPANLTLRGPNPAMPLWIGTAQYLTHDFDGLIDDVRVYERALGKEEIALLYSGYKRKSSQEQVLGAYGATYWGIGGLLGGSNSTIAMYEFDINASEPNMNYTFDSGPFARNGSLGASNKTQRPYWNTSNASIVGSSIWRFENRSAHYTFDGYNDFIHVPYSGVFNLRNFTVELWARKEGLNSYGTQILASFMRGAAQRGWEMRVDDMTSTPRFRLGGIGVSGSEIFEVASYRPMPLHEWVDLVATYSNETGSYNSMRLYMNGELVGERRDTPHAEEVFETPAPMGMDIGFGNRSNCDGCYFNGSIDEVRLYNKSMSARQVYDRYMLRGSYSFDANVTGSSMPVLDGSIYRNNCQNWNATWNETGGIAGGFYDFNATDRVSINCGASNSTNIIALGNRTVMMWFRLKNLPENHDRYPLFARGPMDSAIVGDTLFVTADDANLGITERKSLVYQHRRAPGVSKRVYADVTPLFARIPKNEWLHAAVSYNNQTKEIKVYLNGVRLGYLVDEQMAPADGDFMLGRTDQSVELVPLLLNGSIDEVRVFGRALTDTEIYNEYRSIASPRENFAIRSEVWTR